jgi:uncharacterized protein (UPF0261 family)
MAVLLIGTLDTKAAEIEFVRDLLRQAALGVRVIDVGTGPSASQPDIPRQYVFQAAGTTLEAIQKANDRGKAVEAAARGVTRLALEMFGLGEVEGVMSLGGSAGTTIGTSAMRALPFGVPKLMVSTLASGQVGPYVGVRDICMLYSVVDFAGLNRMSRTVLTNAAGAMIGMVRQAQMRQGALAQGGTPPPADKPTITATMFGVTTPCVQAARQDLEAAGYEVLVFHATGTGGRTMEALIRDGLVTGVLDITTTELADELVGGILSAGPDRLTVAGLCGVPQVVAPGALDMVNFGPRETVPEQFRHRRFYIHNPNVTLMRTTPEENDRLGQEIANKLSAARGPVALLLPLRGVSAIDRVGQPFWWPEADQALFQSIRNWISPNVELIELDLHINDSEFAQAAARTLLRLLHGVRVN